jgi:hypothetical protein
MPENTCFVTDTGTPRLRQQLRAGRSGASESLHNSELNKLTANCTRVYKKSSWNPNSNTPKPDLQKQDRPTVCVVAQQNSSTTFVSPHLHSRKEKKNRRAFQNLIFVSIFVSFI